MNKRRPKSVPITLTSWTL